MKNRYPWILVPLAAALSLSCSEDSPTGTSGSLVSYTTRDSFNQDWVHSFEEDPAGGSVQVFRPAGSREFAPAMFRLAYDFHADGTCAWMVLHPTDAHYMEPATWVTDPGDPNLVSIINPIDIEVVRFRVLSVQPDEMRIEPIKYSVPPCTWRYGQVEVQFKAGAAFSTVDAFGQGLGLEYEYLLRGNVRARAYVLSGDYVDLMSRLESNPIVTQVIHGMDGRDYLIVRFDDDVTEQEAGALLDSFTELETSTLVKDRAIVIYHVPVGSEEEWIETLLAEPMVEKAYKAGSFCP